MKVKKFSYIVVLMLIITLLGGCSKIDKLKVKTGLKNNDFEYMTQNKVEKIVIQSTRDERFKFIVTDKGTVKDLYKILSSAKRVPNKTELDPDYIFEIHENGDKVYKFNYVVGFQEKSIGNFYNDNGDSYQVSKRIDNDIIKNLSTLRKPRKFEELYYDILLKFIDDYGKEIDSSQKVGVNIDDDVEVAKYILSIDLQYFKERLNDKMPNAKVIEKNKEEFDTVINIRTYGYKTKVYKSIITVNDKKNNSETKYYVVCNNDDRGWSINITKEKPDNF
ncbi:hypothetical protein [Clostridium hydrogeniformans]|uniref:hypothetical protein n=1 Tax=Clostridium hydrogeniformans TaxID=349933 RepID=UPI000482454C|nr:hypothetical protein [Clostridium hydrogeniformans]